MCTALTFDAENFYFGRNFDYHFSYGEEVVIAPRNFPLVLRTEKDIINHHAIIGMAYVAENQPLYYDAATSSTVTVSSSLI